MYLGIEIVRWLFSTDPSFRIFIIWYLISFPKSFTGSCGFKIGIFVVFILLSFSLSDFDRDFVCISDGNEPELNFEFTLSKFVRFRSLALLIFRIIMVLATELRGRGIGLLRWGILENGFLTVRIGLFRSGCTFWTDRRLFRRLWAFCISSKVWW